MWRVCDSKLETISSFLAGEAQLCSAEKALQICPLKYEAAVAWEKRAF